MQEGEEMIGPEKMTRAISIAGREYMMEKV